MNEQMNVTEESPVPALVQNDGPPVWCHRHQARGEQVLAVQTKVWIELDVIVTTPDLCQGCLDDLDSWLRLFGMRESADDCVEEEIEIRNMNRPRNPPKSPLDHDPAAVTDAREQLRLTKTALARKCGVSLSLISEIESGTRNATPAMLDKLAEALKRPRETLERKRD